MNLIMGKVEKVNHLKNIAYFVAIFFSLSTVATTQALGQDAANSNPPLDLTGYWVSVVTEGWRMRMVIPEKGDYESTAMTPAAREIADSWDPALDTASGEECRWYGAGGVVRIPGRLHITWEDENILRVDTEAGSQTRLFHFDPSSIDPSSEHSWQGVSKAEWLLADGGREPGSSSGGRLVVSTDQLRMGYIRRNGVPYSDQTELTESYYSFTEPNGDSWLIITTFYDDPIFMTRQFVESTHFKKVDGSVWNPTECSAYR